MIFFIVFCIFITIVLFVMAIYQYLTHSRVESLIEKNKNNDRNFSKKFNNEMRKKLPGIDYESIEMTLRLASNPYGLTVDVLFTKGFSVLAISLIIAFALYFTGVFDTKVFLLPFVLILMPIITVRSKAEEGKKLIKVQLMDFCTRLEQICAGGAKPARAVQWASEGDSLLAKELYYVNQSHYLGVPLYKAFSEHFADKLQIAEASEMGIILKNGEMRGVSIVDPLRELNRDFRQRRQLEMYFQASKLKPAVETILTLTAIIACMVWMVVPVLISAFFSTGITM